MRSRRVVETTPKKWWRWWWWWSRRCDAICGENESGGGLGAGRWTWSGGGKGEFGWTNLEQGHFSPPEQVASPPPTLSDITSILWGKNLLGFLEPSWLSFIQSIAGFWIFLLVVAVLDWIQQMARGTWVVQYWTRYTHYWFETKMFTNHPSSFSYETLFTDLRNLATSKKWNYHTWEYF